MEPVIISAVISAAAAIAVCLINNSFVRRKTDEKHEANIVLISYRLEQLEHKMDVHNNLIERTYELERRADVIEEKQKVANHRLNALEGKETA